MYTQTFLVTSVRGRVFAPQTAASASLSFFGAKMPLPAFFMAAAVFVVFATVVFATVLVVVVIAIEGRKCKHALSLRLRGLRHRGLRNRLGSRRHRD